MAEVEGALGEEKEKLNGSWEAVLGAAKWRVAEPATKAEAEEKPAAASNGDDLSADLQKRAEEGQNKPDEGRTSRILEYFNKT